MFDQIRLTVTFVICCSVGYLFILSNHNPHTRPSSWLCECLFTACTSPKKNQDSNKTWILKNSFLEKFHSRVRCLKLIFFLNHHVRKFIWTVRMEFQWRLRNCERENDENLRWGLIFYINSQASTFLRLLALGASGNFSLSAKTGNH